MVCCHALCQLLHDDPTDSSDRPESLKKRKKSNVYPNFYAEIVPCFPWVRERNISLVRIQSAPPPYNALILNDFMPIALRRDFRGLHGQMPPRDL